MSMMGDGSILIAGFGSTNPPPIFRIIDEDNGNVLFDCNDPTGVYNAKVSGLQTRFGVGVAFNLGSTEDDISEFSPDSAPGGFVTKVTPNLTTTSWRQRIVGPNYPLMIAGANELQRLLRLGGVIALQMTVNDDPKYIDFEPWKVPALFRGDQFEGYFRSNLFRDDGFPVEIRRQPYLRGYQIDAAVNLLDNASLLRSSANGRPDLWAWNSTTGISAESISALNERYEFTIATTSVRAFFQVQPAIPGQFHVFSAYLSGVGSFGLNLVPSLRILYYASTDGTGTPLQTVIGPNIALTGVDTRYVVYSPSGTGAPAGTQSVKFQLTLSNTDASAGTIGVSRAQGEISTSMTAYREGEEAVANNPLSAGGRVFPIHIIGSQPTPVDISVRGESSSNLSRLIVGSRSSEGVIGRNNLVDFINGTHVYQCSNGGLGTNASTVTGGSLPAGAMATTAVKVTPADTQVVRRLRIPITTLLDSLRGGFIPYLRFSSATADLDYTIQAYWSFSNQDPARYPNQRYYLPLNGTAAAGFWFEIPLGQMDIPDNTAITLQGVTLDIYIGASVASKDCFLDVVTFEPADRLSEMFVSDVIKQAWLGSELLDGGSITSKIQTTMVSGSVSGTEYRIDATNESCALAPAAGLPWPAGHHVIRVIGHGAKGNKYAPQIHVGVRNVTDSTNKPDTVNTIDFNPFPGYKTLGSSFSYEVHFNSVAGKLLQPQIVWIAPTGLPAIFISRVEHEFIAAVQQNEKLQSDFISYGIEKLNTDGSIAQYGGVKGRWPVWCDPGLNVLVPIFEDPGVTGAPDVSVSTRAPIVGFSYKPRWYQ